MFSMGVTFFVMFHNRFPFQLVFVLDSTAVLNVDVHFLRSYNDRKQMLREIKNYPQFIRSRYVKDLPSTAVRLVEELLHPDENKRASVQAILNNAYLKSKVAN